MPQPYDYDDDEDDYSDDSGRGDDLVKQLRKQLKEQSKLLKDLGEENKKLSGTVRERTVADVLAARGVNPKVAKLMPSDIEASPEAVENWINDWSDVFNIPRDTPAAEQAEAPAEAAAYDRMRAVENGGLSASGTEALQQKIALAGNEAELMAALRQAGAAS